MGFFIFRNATTQPYVLEKWKGCVKTRNLLAKSRDISSFADLKSGHLKGHLVVYSDFVSDTG